MQLLIEHKLRGNHAGVTEKTQTKYTNRVKGLYYLRETGLGTIHGPVQLQYIFAILYLSILLHAILKRLCITQSVNNATNCSFFFHFHF
jgi:hypothetical protein